MASCWEHFLKGPFMRAGRVISVLALTLVVTANGRAQTSSRMSPEELNRLESYTHVPPDVKAFAADYVAAWNTKDPERVLALTVPEWRKCVTPDNKGFYYGLLQARMHDPVPAHYLLSLMPVNEDNLKAMAQEAYFPLKPERELHIDYDYPDSRDGGQLLVYLVHEKGRWMEDSPCASAHAIQEFREDAADRAKYKAMAAGIREPLRGQLLGMLKKHQRGEAEERYKAATGCDMKTATLVIFALDGAMP